MSNDISTASILNSSDDGPLPDHIGPYIVLGVLGEGGFGVVYEAEQADPKRRVALKVIKAGMDSKAVIARFEAERQALAVMDHACVAKIFDGGVTEPEHGGRPYFAMELVRGEPITVYCDKNRMSIESRVELFKRVCEAVQHAHTKGVIHRDLKPSNIMVAHSEDGPVPKVIDFGVAKAINQRLGGATIFTEQGQMIGTPEYMSPEQAEMAGVDIDTRSDIYSLGVILYELLSGRRPFESTELRRAGLAEIQRIIREEDPPRPSTRVSTAVTTDAELASKMARARQSEPRQLERRLRGELDWVVMKCLAKERDRRYESANGLAAELGKYLEGDVVQARPPSRAYRARKFAHKNKTAAMAAAVIAAVLVAAAGVSLAFAVDAERARGRAELALVDRDNALASERLEREAAEKARQQALQRSADLESAMETIERIFWAVEPSRGGGSITVKEMLVEQSLAIAALEKSTPDIAARLYFTMAQSFLAADEYESALVQAQNAQRILCVAWPGVHSVGIATEAFRQCVKARLFAIRVKARLVDDLADRDISDNRINEAVNETIALINELEGVRGGESLYSQAWFRLGRVRYSLRDFEGAIQALQASIEISLNLTESEIEQSRDSSFETRRGLLIEARSRIAQIYVVQRRESDAESAYLENLEATRIAFGEFGREYAQTLGFTAWMYGQFGHSKLSLSYLFEASELTRRVLGEHHEYLLTNLRASARMLVQLGRREDAAWVMAELFSRVVRDFGPEHTLVARRLNQTSELVFGTPGVPELHAALQSWDADDASASLQRLDFAIDQKFGDQGVWKILAEYDNP